jgi:hypothetical protein
MVGILECIFLFHSDYMEHTVSGVGEMHVSLMKLTAGVCQPEENCADCTTYGKRDMWLGLNVSDSHTL